MMVKRLATAAVLVLALQGRAAAPRPAAGPVVVELLTSQSCPPADALLAAIAIAIAAAAADGPAATLRLERDGNRLRLEAGAGHGAGQLLLIGFDPAHTTRVGGGERGGRQPARGGAGRRTDSPAAAGR